MRPFTARPPVTWLRPERPRPCDSVPAPSTVNRQLLYDRPVSVRPLPENLGFQERVALPDRVDDGHPLRHPPEDDVLAVQVLRRAVGDEELAAVRVLPVVGQAQDAPEVAAVAGLQLVAERVAGAALPVVVRLVVLRQRVAPLDHEVLDDPVE